MSRISTEQIIEILDDVREIRIRKGSREDTFVVETYEATLDSPPVDKEVGIDLGEIVNELHVRL